MADLIHAINRTLSAIFGVLLLPFHALNPFWALAFISLVAGILMVWVFGKVSDQESIDRTKTRIQGNLLGVWLYQHNVGVVLRLQKHIFGDILRYLKLSLVPLLVLIIPILLIMTQLNLYFGTRPLHAGEQAVIKLHLTQPPEQKGKFEIHQPDGVEVETPAVRIPSLNEVVWRVRATKPGRYNLSIDAGGEVVTKELVVADRWDAVSTMRTQNWLDELLYSSEPPIEAGKHTRSVEVFYRPLEIPVWTWYADWLTLFLVLSIVFGFAFKGVLGVQV